MLIANTALLIIDVQLGFVSDQLGDRNNPDAENRIEDLLILWRQMSQLVVHVQHVSEEPNSPFRAGQPGVAFKKIVKPLPGEHVIQKHVNSAFIGTDLERLLRSKGIETLVVTGLSTDHCISTTVRMAGNLGFRTYLVADATATFGRLDHKGVYYEPEVVHALALASLHGEFAEVIDLADLFARLEEV